MSALSRSPSASSSDCSSEGEDGYAPGGYHRVQSGEVLCSVGNHYGVQGKLGWGNFSTVWACTDKRNLGVAVKIGKAHDRYKVVFQDEVKLLEAVARHCKDPKWQNPHVVRLLEHFQISGPNGTHPCLVFERLGPSLLELMRCYHRSQVPPNAVRVIARHCLLGLDFLQRGCGIIHTDIKPENIMLRLSADFSMDFHQDLHQELNQSAGSEGPPKKKQRLTTKSRRDVRREALDRCLAGYGGGFCIVDFGNGCFADAHVSDYIQTCQYKSPEVLLGAGYDYTADIWSLGCTLFECIQGDYLFDPRVVGERRRCHLNVDDDFNLPERVPREEEHLAQIAETLGPIPEGMIHRGLCAGEFLSVQPDGTWLLTHAKLPLHTRAKDTPQEEVDADAEEAVRTLEEMLGESRSRKNRAATGALAPLIGAMLCLEPKQRPVAETLLGFSECQSRKESSPFICVVNPS